MGERWCDFCKIDTAHVSHRDDCRRAAPKIESAEAPGAGVVQQFVVARIAAGLREWARLDLASMAGYRMPSPEALEKSGGYIAARMLESLSTRNRALEAVIAEHNKRCERECDNCGNMRDSFGHCFICPRRYILEVPK